MTVIAYRPFTSYHLNDDTKRVNGYHSQNHIQRVHPSRHNTYTERMSTGEALLSSSKSLVLTVDDKNYSCTRYNVGSKDAQNVKNFRGRNPNKEFCNGVRNSTLSKVTAIFPELSAGVVQSHDCRKRFDGVDLFKTIHSEELVQRTSSGMIDRTDKHSGITFRAEFGTCVMLRNVYNIYHLLLSAGTCRTVGRRKEGEQKSEKQKKGEDGNKYGQKDGNDRNRRGSQGNGSSGMEGSGEGSGNGEDSSDDEDDDGDDEEQDDEEDEEEEEEDEMEEDTDNVSAMAEDEAEDTTNGGGETESVQVEINNRDPQITATTLEIHTSGGSLKDDVTNDEETMTSMIAPAEPGTPVTLSGVIWKETMGGVLVVNLKWRNKTYCGSLIDNSRYGWANPRNLDGPQECDLTKSSRSCKGKKGKHKESAYTGNPLSPKMSGKRGPRFHRNKGKHNKELSSKSKTKRGSDTAEEGTRTRRRSCTVKTSVSPSPSPTPLIECPERNCNKKYKHINGLRYHQAHAHLDNAADGEDKDSYDEDDTKCIDLKEPLSANSKSSGSDDVKPLSHRKAKKLNSKAGEASEVSVAEDSVQNGEKLADTEETGEKYDVVDVKVEELEPMKIEESSVTAPKPNILEEAVKIIFDEPAVSHDLMVPSGIFSRMTSQAMLAASHSTEYNKYVGYEAMDEVSYGEKAGASSETQELDDTVKEEVIDEGHAGVPKITCKEETDETLKLENAEIRFNGAKSSELTTEETPKTTEDDKSKWLPEKAGKLRKTDGASVPKEPMKTSAAEIRSLPGYKHFRLPPNNNAGFLTQGNQEKYAKSLTLDTGLLESKDSPKGGIPKDAAGAARQERAGEKADNKSMVWKIPGAPSASSASFQLTCESKARPGYMASSRKPSVVTASTTWVPEVHPAVINKMTGGGISGQEILPEKPHLLRETAEKLSPRPRDAEEDQEGESTKAELGKGDEERSKGTYSGKPARAVGVAHPFNAEKSEGEFDLGMVGSIHADPVRVLYSKSSSPKVSVDNTHPDMTEVKKVRVEKTLEVPVGEVVPLANTSRSVVTAATSRGSVMIGNENRGNFGEVRVSEDRVPRTVAPSPPIRDPQQLYTSSLVERSSSWRPSSHSPSHESRSRGDTTQHNIETYTSQHRKPVRRSPVPDHRSFVPDHCSPVPDHRSSVPDNRSPSFRSIAGGHFLSDIGRRTPEKDMPERFRGFDKRLPFRNIDDRLAQKESGKVVEVARNSPGRDNSGSMYPRSNSPRKDTPGIHRRVTGYRDPERRSPFADATPRRQYNRSPIRDRRSPTHARSSPDREMVESSSHRGTSPNPLRDAARHSPFKDRIVKQPGESEMTSQRKDVRSPGGESRTVEVSRGYRMKSEMMPSKESGDSVGSQRTSAENKLQGMTEEEYIMHHVRQAALYQYHASYDAMENYMISRMSAGFDPRLIKAYPAMFTAAQMPLLLQQAKENTAAKEERPKETPEDIRRKPTYPKPESSRSRGESSEADITATKRHAERTNSSRISEKAENESVTTKRSKTNEVKDVHEIIDERGMQHKTLEQRALQQEWQHRMDALHQLQTEKSQRLKTEERSIRTKPPSSSSSARPKPTMQESRTITKREDKVFSKEEKSRLSPATMSNNTNSSSNTGDSTITVRSRNPECKSPVPTSSGTFLGFVPPANLPANHGLSNSYEQAMAMQGYSPFIMHPSFPLPHGMMMANPLAPGSQLHARGFNRKRDSTRGIEERSERARPRDDDNQDNESRRESREISSQTKKDIGATPRINPPTPTPMEKPKEKPRGDYDEGKRGIYRDTSSIHGTQALPTNLAYRRADMSGGGIDPAQLGQAFPGMIYPAAQGSFTPPFDHSFISHQRK